ncbi:hypothetical protein Bca52824_078798 [Brassica carinata]|uniref:Partial AB-hydrolase lipase domain-containing protein n=1 Tax=Brassica carinata TaxID=52824 RepID=A0A8X7PW63_BRACI|nr:hypothetical protein Bca52824_078798 [Brassica carinata]
MFEKYKVPALFMAKNPVLTSFATRSATSLAVDCGGGSTTIAPVHEGYVLQKVYEQVMESINKSCRWHIINATVERTLEKDLIEESPHSARVDMLASNRREYIGISRLIPTDVVLQIRRIVDNALAVTKESVKTLTYESLNNIARSINGVSALLLTLLPGKASVLEGLHGWELRPTLRAPRLPRWMHNGVSSFNHFIHELSVDSDASSLDYSSGEDSDDAMSTPPSPLSQTSLRSWATLPANYESHWTEWITLILWWVLLPSRIFLWVPLHLLGLFSRHSPRPYFSKAVPGKEHHVPNRTTDRRRGVIEDLQLGIEIFIDAIFDFFHKAAHLLLSPSEAFGILLSWFSSSSQCHSPEGNYDDVLDDETLGDNYSSSPTERTTTSLYNTDTRTCQDVITELGYPYEAIRVVTSDGYGLLLERIPRRDARKAVFLQHGVLDSSMGWVSNGVVGSPAFAAYDQGYDVYLGNFRGLVSRDHVNKNISSKDFWSYSINEHAREDIPAMIEKIHEIKTSELKLYEPNTEEVANEEQPYKLCVLSHSLGGAAVLMYVITSRIEEKPHRLSRLILLSPAGFHEDSNLCFTLIEHTFLLLGPVLSRIVPAFYIPTRFFRMLLNKLARDFHNYPAVGGLVQTLMSYVVGGDSSNWLGVMGLPHYNMNDMPAVSFRVALHLAQIKRSSKFKMFDYGSVKANMEVYGSPEPLDLGEFYGLIDVPVDLVAGKKDKVIRPSMVRKHYRVMRETGVVDASYNEFEYAHLDFTFSHREELLAYVMSRLLLVEPTQTQPVHKKGMKLKKKIETSRL